MRDQFLEGKMIKVVEIADVGVERWNLEVDGYIPLSFQREIEGFPGVTLQLGNIANSLLELDLEDQSNEIRGFTLVGFDAIHQPRVGNVEAAVVKGIPVIGGLEGYERFGTANLPFIKFGQVFTFGKGSGFVELDFGGIRAADRLARFGQVDFLLRKDELVGVRVNRFSAKQWEAIEGHFRK